MSVKLKRVYKRPEAADGIRILVDRLWPRGIEKAQAKIDEWQKELAPSNDLRRWYGHRPDRWIGFASRYKRELQSEQKQASLRRLQSLAQKERITLVFAAKDAEHCNARVLLDVLDTDR